MPITCPRMRAGFVVSAYNPPDPPPASSTAGARNATGALTLSPASCAIRRPITRSPSVKSPCAITPSMTCTEGVARTTAISVSMILRPAWSPCTRTTRAVECAASWFITKPPWASRSNGVPWRGKIQNMVARGLCDHARHVRVHRAPRLRANVSAAWASGVSGAAMAAAIPPCAQAEDAPSPKVSGEMTKTGRGAKASAA